MCGVISRFGTLHRAVVGLERLVAEDVERGGGDAAAAQRVGQRILVDQGSAADIDDDGGRLHQRELGAPIRLRVAAVCGAVSTTTSAAGSRSWSADGGCTAVTPGGERRVRLPPHAGDRGAERREAHGGGAADAAEADDQDAARRQRCGWRAARCAGRWRSRGHRRWRAPPSRPAPRSRCAWRSNASGRRRNSARTSASTCSAMVSAESAAGVGHEHRAGDHLRIQHVADAGRGAVNPAQAPRRLQLGRM